MAARPFTRGRYRARVTCPRDISLVNNRNNILSPTHDMRPALADRSSSRAMMADGCVALFFPPAAKDQRPGCAVADNDAFSERKCIARPLHLRAIVFIPLINPVVHARDPIVRLESPFVLNALSLLFLLVVQRINYITFAPFEKISRLTRSLLARNAKTLSAAAIDTSRAFS